MCDGPSKMFYAQGPWSRLATLNPSFLDPPNSHRIIHIILDVYNMLKLVHNTLGSRKKWEYITYLHSLQKD